MTRRLDAQFEAARQRARRVADLGCRVADLIRHEGPTPGRLDEVQTGLRQQMLWVEQRLRDLRSRRMARATRIKDRVRRRPVLADTAKRHRELVKELEAMLQLERALLRQVGDSCAWLVLREDQRVILPLYIPQTHQLPERLGLAAPAEVAQRLHAGGSLLAVENDLTRCLGVGDLTVVFADRPWRNPLILEIKASGEWKLGATAEIGITTAHSDAPEDVALFDEVSRIIGQDITPERVQRLERQNQIDRLLSHTRALASITANGGVVLGGSSRRMWRTLETVVLRALTEGRSYDLADPGVAFLAVRVDRGDAKEQLLGAVDGLEFMGFGRECGAATSGDYLREDEWTAVVPPIPLWPINRGARAALMTGDMYFAAVVKPELWKTAMEAEVQLEETPIGGWRVVGTSGELHLDVVEVQKLSRGVAFTGISPRDVGRRIAEFLAKTGASA